MLLTVTLADALQLAASIPVTVYLVGNVGDTVKLLPVVPVGCHVYDTIPGPNAFNCNGVLKQMVVSLAGEIVTVGDRDTNNGAEIYFKDGQP